MLQSFLRHRVIPSASADFLSGCRGSNSGCMTPSHAYYHYTTARPFEVLFRAAGNRTRSTPAPRPRMCPAHPEKSFYRGAGNRTRSTRTRSVRTTGILHPDKRTSPRACDYRLRPVVIRKANVLLGYTTARKRTPWRLCAVCTSLPLFRTLDDISIRQNQHGGTGASAIPSCLSSITQNKFLLNCVACVAIVTHTTQICKSSLYSDQ